MRAGRAAPPRALRTALLGIASSAVFMAGPLLIAVATDVFGALVGSPFLAAVWLAATAVVARRFSPREPRTH
jgi:hypothetical protein